MDEPLLITIGAVQRLLCIGRTKAYEMTARGELPTIRIGRNLRVPRQARSRGGSVALLTRAPAPEGLQTL